MKKKVVIAVLIAVVVLAVAGGVIYKFGISNNKLSVAVLLKGIDVAGLNDSQKLTIEEIRGKLMKDPNDYSGLLELAGLKQGLNDYDGAIALYEELRKIQPNDIVPLNNLGSIYYNLGEYEKSEQMYLKILNDITPKWLNSYNELFAIYQFHLKGKKEAYEAVLLRGIEEYPEMEQNLVSKAAVYYDELMNDKVKALEYYQRMLKFDPSNSVIKARISELKKQK